MKQNGSKPIIIKTIAHDNIAIVLKLDKIIQNVFEIIEGDQQCN